MQFHYVYRVRTESLTWELQWLYQTGAKHTSYCPFPAFILFLLDILSFDVPKIHKEGCPLSPTVYNHQDTHIWGISQNIWLVCWSPILDRQIIMWRTLDPWPSTFRPGVFYLPGFPLNRPCSSWSHFSVSLLCGYSNSFCGWHFLYEGMNSVRDWWWAPHCLQWWQTST